MTLEEEFEKKIGMGAEHKPWNWVYRNGRIIPKKGNCTYEDNYVEWLENKIETLLDNMT